MRFVDDCSANSSVLTAACKYVYTIYTCIHTHTHKWFYMLWQPWCTKQGKQRVPLDKLFNCIFFGPYCNYGTRTILTTFKPFCGYCLFQRQRHACSKLLFRDQFVCQAMAGRICTFIRELPRTTHLDCRKNPISAALTGILKKFELIITYYT